MNHLLHNLRPRGIARRLAHGRWDFSTEHVFRLAFVREFLGRNFGVSDEPRFFWSPRRWALKKEIPSGVQSVVEVYLINGELRASGYMAAPSASGGKPDIERLTETALHVPDESLSTERMSGSEKAKLILQRIAAYAIAAG